jgi:nucleoside-diphosphate-sugar epimerase
VGGTLARQARFDEGFRSTDIERIGQRDWRLVVCAGAPGQKWLANREPEADRAGIERLIRALDTVRCETMVLVSTVDVFARPIGVDEDSPVDESALSPYGLHRRLLERFVQQRFADHLVLRLSGLVGPGLRKNAIYDLHHGNALHAIDSRGVFQFYPMVNLWWDLLAARAAGLRLAHLSAEPVSVAEIAEAGFGRRFEQALPGTPARYDFRSRHAAVFGGAGHYAYDKRDTLQAVRAYAQSEPRGSGA